MGEGQKIAAQAARQAHGERFPRPPILLAPCSNGLPGPIPAQGDFLDPRWRPINNGASSELIPFQRPGWMSIRDWEAYRKGAKRKSTYTIRYTVEPTYRSMRHYTRYRRSQREEEREAQWWTCEIQEIDALITRAKEIRARIERAAIARHAAPAPGESRQWVEVLEVVFPAASVSYGLRCMVEAGHLPGLSFDAGRNVVRTTMVRRFVEVAA